MPKMKTHSRAKKTFSLTGTGKVKRQQAGMRHILTKKSKCRKTRLGKSALVCEAEVPRVKRMLCL
jgi:large subunit ribosomal protein L35